jgi:hypothetical protein
MILRNKKHNYYEAEQFEFLFAGFTINGIQDPKTAKTKTPQCSVLCRSRAANKPRMRRVVRVCWIVLSRKSSRRPCLLGLGAGAWNAASQRFWQIGPRCAPHVLINHIHTPGRLVRSRANHALPGDGE